MDKIIYMIFIASIMVGNGIYFGPCTIRQYGAIFFFMYIIRYYIAHKESLSQSYSKLIVLYIIFILSYGFSSILNNSLTSYIKQLIALYMVSIIAYYTTVIMFKKYHSFKYFINSFMLVGLVNAVVNIMQYLGISKGYLFGAIFINLDDPVKLAQYQNMLEGKIENTFGIMGDIVYNSYYSMVLPFALIIRYKYKNVLLKGGLLLLSLVSLFVVGERSAFGITLILLAFYFYKTYRKSPVFVFCMILAVCVFAYYISDVINSDAIQNSRWITAQDSARDNINKAIIPFIKNNLLFGNLTEFIKLTGFPPHNVIASSFVYAGAVGGCAIIYTLFFQAKITLSVINTNDYILYALAFAAYTLNGLFHNPAIVTGDAMVWILWAIVLCCYNSYCHSIKHHMTSLKLI